MRSRSAHISSNTTYNSQRHSKILHAGSAGPAPKASFIKDKNGSNDQCHLLATFHASSLAMCAYEAWRPERWPLGPFPRLELVSSARSDHSTYSCSFVENSSSSPWNKLWLSKNWASLIFGIHYVARGAVQKSGMPPWKSRDSEQIQHCK